MKLSLEKKNVRKRRHATFTKCHLLKINKKKYVTSIHFKQMNSEHVLKSN